MSSLKKYCKCKPLCVLNTLALCKFCKHGKTVHAIHVYLDKGESIEPGLEDCPKAKALAVPNCVLLEMSPELEKTTQCGIRFVSPICSKMELEDWAEQLDTEQSRSHSALANAIITLVKS